MNSNPIDAVSESAKALGEITKTGGKGVDASGRAGGWLETKARGARSTP